MLTSFYLIVFCFDFHPIFGGVCFHTFWILLPCFSFLFSPYYIRRMDNFGKTVTVQTPPPEFRRFTQATVLPGILVNLGKEALHSIQFLPGGSFRASFSSPEHKVRIESKGRFNIGSHECVVQATGPPKVDVYVHYYPFEAPDADIRSVLSKFGQIKGLRYQSFPGYSNVKTGSRIVRMVVEREIPSQQSIRGYPCRGGTRATHKV